MRRRKAEGLTRHRKVSYDGQAAEGAEEDRRDGRGRHVPEVV